MNTIKHWLFSIKRKIKYFFHPERNRLSKQSRLNRRTANIIKDFFECDETGKYSNFNYTTLQITKVNVKEKKNEVTITVELGRPGLIIGKAGRTLDDITFRLATHFKKRVYIKIVESFLF